MSTKNFESDYLKI